MKNRAFNLMKNWCDTLLSYQIKTNVPDTDGALLCPACHVLHGRVADLCFPLSVIWSKTGDERYLEKADKLIEWSEHNLKTPDGLWFNDACNHWRWTSTFSSIALGETLLHFSSVLPRRYLDKWEKIYSRMVETLYGLDEEYERNKNNPRVTHPITNYFCAMGATLALAWKNTGEQKFLQKAIKWIDLVFKERVDDDGLLFGEGTITPYDDGSHTIDMGYALEESLPLLMRFASISGIYKEEIHKAFSKHLLFVLPDGGIDNSFGVRHNKWTYWGSRTSDGIMEGLAFAMDDPLFVDVARRTLDLYEKCTHDGLLSMPMAHEANEPTCLHHSFPHAKSLASFICDAPNDIKIQEPLENEKFGVKKFQNDRLILISKGIFRATFSAVNANTIRLAENGGGSMNLLYVDGYGITCAATSAYFRPSEPFNQQLSRHDYECECMTAQFIVDGEQACMDKSVKISSEGTTVTAVAKKWSAKYAFTDTALNITLQSADAVYSLPIVCSKDNSVKVTDGGKTLVIADTLRIRSSVAMEVDENEREFNQVGGLLYLPINIAVKDRVSVTVDKI